MKILNIISSINGEASFSNKLSNAILEKLEEAYPSSQVNKYDLSKNPLPYLETLHYGAFFTPSEHYSADQKKLLNILMRPSKN